MYEIGRAPEKEGHPDHALASELARGLWASLPLLDSEVLGDLLVRARGLDGDAVKEIVRSMDTDEMRLALGRIACGYDGRPT